MKIEIHGQTVHFLPQHALYFEDIDVLAVADVHLGKPEMVQEPGHWSPHQLNNDDLQRIRELVKELQPESLYIIGDFVHDILGLTPDLAEQVRQWRSELNCAVVLLEGNRDRKTQPYLQEWNMVVAQSMTAENLVFSHEPAKPDKPGQLVVSGHVHPMLRLESENEQERRPCFVWEDPQLILPSFGSCTSSGVEIRRHSFGRYFSVKEGQVIEV